MAERLALDIDVHRVSKAIAGVVAGGDFEDSVGSVVVAPQNAQGRRALRNAKRLGDIGTGGDGLYVLRDLHKIDLCQSFDLFENRVLCRADLTRDVRQAFVDVGDSVRQRLGRIGARAQPLKAAPAPACDKPQLLGNIARQRPFAQRIEYRARVTCILKDFGDIGQWLMQRTTTRRCRLDTRSRSAPPRNKAFGLQRAQSFAHRKARYSVALAKVAFGREYIAVIAPAQHLFAQFVSQFLVSRLSGQTLSPRPAALRA